MREMNTEMFNPQGSMQMPSVTSSRILHTPSTFARTSLLHLQEKEYSGSDPIKKK